MNFAFDRPHGDAIVSELVLRIGRIGSLTERLRNFRDGERIDERRKRTRRKIRTKLWRGRHLRRADRLRQSQTGGKNSAAMKKISPSKRHFRLFSFTNSTYKKYERGHEKPKFRMPAAGRNAGSK